MSVLPAFILLAALAATGTSARGQALEVRAASVSGRAVITRTTSPVSLLRSGELLAPGDLIDTSAGGKVRIELNDGSIIIVQPGTRLILQDYNAAGSLRQLLKIFVGRIRIKINRFGAQPNPYRVNSPSASIGVRGTEFGVFVGTGGETEIVVYEGLVEVTSLSNPQNPVIVEPGRGVIVRPNEPIHFFLPRPENEIGEPGENPEGNELAGSGAVKEREESPIRTASGVYERYIESVVDSSQNTLPSFAAFPDSFLDSLENPAFATEFSAPQGRILLLPSFARPSVSEGLTLFSFGNQRPLDYSISPQTFFFAPVKHRLVVGGVFTFSRTGIQSFSLDENVALTGPPLLSGATGTRTTVGAADNTFLAGSVVISRRFGSDDRTSIGIGLDFLSQRGSLLDLTSQADGSGLAQLERVESRSTVGRTRITIGFARNFGVASKLGIYYRYGYISANDRNLSHTLDGDSLPLEVTRVNGRSSEIGIRLRGPITHRLFYGVEGNLLRANSSETTQPTVDSNERSRSTRALIGFGLGYSLRPRTLLAFDVAGGSSRAYSARREDATGNILEAEHQTAHFLSLHGAVQADVWRRLFVSGSILSLTQSRATNLGLFPNRFGQRLTSEGILAPAGRRRDKFSDYFSNFGVGWRFAPNLLVQYILSTDFGQTSPRHTLMLRYTFIIGGK